MNAQRRKEIEKTNALLLEAEAILRVCGVMSFVIHQAKNGLH